MHTGTHLRYLSHNHISVSLRYLNINYIYIIGKCPCVATGHIILIIISLCFTIHILQYIV
jgi:hypothetical protein